MDTSDFDPIYDAFLEHAEREAAAISAESDTTAVFPLPAPSGRPSHYAAIFHGIEHYVRRPSAEPRLTDEPILAGFHFPTDYLRSGDPHLLFKVVHILSPVLNPNVSGVTLCLGSSFRAGTSLRVLVHQVHAIFSAGRFSTTSPLDREAADFYVANAEKIRALRSQPLYREPIVTNLRRVEGDAGRARREAKR